MTTGLLSKPSLLHGVRRGWLRPWIAGMALGCAVTPALAHADPTTDAKDLFERGRTLRAHDDCADAIPLFRRALEAYPAGLGSLRNIAECQESLGQFTLARRAWIELGQTLEARGDLRYEPRYDGWADDCRQSAERLAPQAASEESKADRSREADRHAQAGTTRRSMGWVALGVGSAGLVGAGISWLVRQSALDDIDHAGCSSGPDGSLVCAGVSGSVRTEVESASDRGKTASTAATVFLVTGLVGLGTGLVLVATSRARSTPTVGLFLSPTGASVVGRF